MANSTNSGDEIVSKVKEIYSLPSVMQKILEIIDSPKAGAPDMQKVLERDPPLAARVLQTANSAYYAQSDKISELRTAVVLLGFDTIRNIALGRSVYRWFKDSPENRSGFSRVQLWDHSIAVAACGRMIAQRLGYTYFDTLFAAGLLHDIGIILEDQYLHEEFMEAISRYAKGNRPFCEIEQEVLGTNHTELGAKLLESWNFPVSLIRSVQHHHYPMEQEEDSRAFPCIVNLANFICESKGMTMYPKSGAGQVPDRRVIQYLNLTKEDMEVFLEDLDSALESVQDLREMVRS